MIDLERAAGHYAAGANQVEMPRYQRYVDDFEEFAVAIREGQPLSITPEGDLLVQEALIMASEM